MRKAALTTLDLLRNLASVDFWVLLSRVFDSFCGGCIKLRILPPQNESKLGQNNPENRRSLSCARGLLGRDKTLQCGRATKQRRACISLAYRDHLLQSCFT